MLTLKQFYAVKQAVKKIDLHTPAHARPFFTSADIAPRLPAGIARENSFALLKYEFYIAFATPTESKHDRERLQERALHRLTDHIVGSVLKSIANRPCAPREGQKVGGINSDRVINILRGQFYAERDREKRARYAHNNAYEKTTRRDRNGNIKKGKRVKDRDTNEFARSAGGENLCDAFSLRTVAKIRLLELCAQYGYWVDQKITVKRPKKRVLILGEQQTYVNDELTILQAVYRAVRQAIESMQKSARGSDKYLYFDNGNGSYTRLQKYRGTATNAGGVITIEPYALEREQELMQALQLTERQQDIVTCRLCGMGYKKIASRYNISVRSVRTHIERAAEKLTAVIAPELIERTRADLDAGMILTTLFGIARAVNDTCADLDNISDCERVTPARGFIDTICAEYKPHPHPHTPSAPIELTDTERAEILQAQLKRDLQRADRVNGKKVNCKPAVYITNRGELIDTKI